MITNKQLLFTFGPAILIALGVLAFRISQYEPLYPEDEYTGEENRTEVAIPILPFDPVIGDKRALKTIVAFEDFGCAACAESMQMFWLVLNKHPGKIKMIWKSLPVVRIPTPSDQAHLYGLCAAKQGKFELYTRAIFENGNNVSEEAISAAVVAAGLNAERITACATSASVQSELDTTKQIATALRIQEVPTLFIDNKQVETPRTIEGWEALLGL